MKAIIRLLAPALLMAGLAFAGCSGSAPRTTRKDDLVGPAANTAPQAPTTGLLAPPAPDTLATQLQAGGRHKAASYTPSDLLMQAEDFDAAILHKHVSATADGLEFDPNWRVGDTSIDSLAYAFYHFTVAGYGGNAVLKYSWINPPDSADSIFFALANFDTNSWDWFTGNDAAMINLSGTAHYIAPGGTMFVGVVAIGSNLSTLDWLRLGSQPPEPSLSATPLYGLAPLTVDFDATGSTDPDGTVAEYKWDPQGDGTFDATSGTDPTFSYEYSTPGDYGATVRVIDNNGVYADQTILISAAGGAGFSYGSPGSNDHAYGMAVCDDGHLFLAGEFSVTGVAPQAVAIKVSPNGTADFAKKWGGDSGDGLRDAVLADDSYIYACGYTEDGVGHNGLLQKWSQDGALVWSKSIGSSDQYETFNTLMVRGDNIYVCGYSHQSGTGLDRAILACLDRSGSLIWDTGLASPNDCAFTRMVYASSIQAGGNSIRLCGYYDQSGSDRDALYASYDVDGNLTASQTWGTASSKDQGEAISLIGFTHPAAYVACSSVQGGQGTASLGKPGGTMVEILPPAGTTLLSPVGLLALNVLFDDSDDSTRHSIVLASFDTSLNVLSETQLSAVPDGQNYPTNMVYYGSGVALTGSQTGALPATGDIALNTQTSATSWVDISPAAAPLSTWYVGLTATTTQNIGSYYFDRDGTNLDDYVYVGSL